VSQKYEQEAFTGKNDKVLYYTGLPTFEILKSLFSYLESYIPVKKSIRKFKMLILTLMRLRLNVTALFLSYEFKISVATVSRVITDVIDVMYIRMKPLVFLAIQRGIKKINAYAVQETFWNKMCSDN
jgi:hypothetical protein